MKKFKAILMSLMLSILSVTAYGNAAVVAMMAKKERDLREMPSIMMPIVSDGFFRVPTGAHGYSPKKMTERQMSGLINDIKQGHMRHVFDSNGQILFCMESSADCADDYSKRYRLHWKTPQETVRAFIGGHADYAGMALSHRWITIFYTLN